MKRSISVNNLFPSLVIPKNSITDLFRTLDDLPFTSPPPGEFSIAFIDDSHIAQVHLDFMDDPTPTDVITFPGDPSEDFAGEILVSVDHAIARSDELNIPFNKELALYLVHGFLHLSGFDDIEESDRAKMRQAEQQALQALEKAGSLPNFSLSQ